MGGKEGLILAAGSGRDVLKGKFRGCLVGLALGDALGAPFEGAGSVDKREVFAAAERRQVLRYTDDTHMAVGVAESLIACRGFDGSHMAGIFIRNFEREPWRGYGPGPPLVFQRIKLGVPWDRVAEEIYPGGSFGNGAAMRVAPVGLFYYRDTVRLREVAFLSAQITHAHFLGKEGAALQAFAVALAVIYGPSGSPEDLLERMGAFVTERVYRDKLEKMKDLLGAADPAEVAVHLGNGIEAFNSVPAAICCFLRHPGSFEEAVTEAVGLGGDADTIASMTGAISGAWLGIEAIPVEWTAKLENRDYIEELAVRLWETALGQE
ncbi:ADP-ribosylglycohydrolase family protein [Desulfovirgula thermocuniculi]|uniref:ADP-ribosylglycohydrolase family protein n=1 Tax=Desulfovirgula thermocuniculi TaxID=348842 RepID=UPI0006845210|nr:ADP-ribosylglycohydrolase family protein [Desulfovirgula thermocuniculi]